MTGVDLRAPGLYLERSAETAAPALLSAVTAFVGVAERGPLFRPQTIASWGEFLDVFGSFLAFGHLAQSVYGFFLNGGERCIVVRVADANDYSAENVAGSCPRRGLLAAATNSAVIVDRLGMETIALTAINQGRWGDALQYSFQPASRSWMPLTTLSADASALLPEISVEQPFDIEPPGVLRLQHPTDPILSRTVTVVDVDATTGIVDLSDPVGVDLPEGTRVLGKGFKLLVSDGSRTETFDNLSMSPDNPRYFVDVVNGEGVIVDYVERQKLGMSILVNAEHVLGAGDQSRFRPASSVPSVPPPAISFDPMAGGGDGVRFAEVELPGAGGDRVATVVVRNDTSNAAYHGSAGNALTVDVSDFESSIALPVPAVAGGPLDTLTVENASGFSPGDIVTIERADNPAITEDRTIDTLDGGNVINLAAPLGNDYPAGSPVRVADRVTLTLQREGQAEPLERHYNLSGDPASPRAIATIVNADSTVLCAEPPALAGIPGTGVVQLELGSDPGQIAATFYTGYEASGATATVAGGLHDGPYGVATLETIDDVNLIAVPDLTNSIGASDDASVRTAELVSAQRQILAHCAKMAERFALLDTLEGLSTDEAITHSAAMAGDQNAKFGALYYPWLDQAYQGDLQRMPPSGPIAGLVARSDRLGGLNKAPANLPLLGIVDLELRVDRDSQDLLNPAGVNCIRKIRDGAIFLWAARTLSQERRSRYVNMRRVLLGVNKFLSRSLLWTVFEPASETLWRRIEATLTAFLQSVYATGLTAGGRPGDAFYVKCNRETNPPEIIDAGRVVAEIGLALVAPAEFIVLSVRRNADSVNVVEEDI